jgi:hypothetical protein
VAFLQPLLIDIPLSVLNRHFTIDEIFTPSWLCEEIGVSAPLGGIKAPAPPPPPNPRSPFVTPYQLGHRLTLRGLFLAPSQRWRNGLSRRCRHRLRKNNNAVPKYNPTLTMTIGFYGLELPRGAAFPEAQLFRPRARAAEAMTSSAIVTITKS